MRQLTSTVSLPNYVKIGAYALLNFNAEYAFDKNTTVAVGATNLLDQNYQLAQGFPEAGRHVLRQRAREVLIAGTRARGSLRSAAEEGPSPMRISARNIIKGTIEEVVKGQTTAHVRINLGDCRHHGVDHQRGRRRARPEKGNGGERRHQGIRCHGCGRLSRSRCARPRVRQRSHSAFGGVSAHAEGTGCAAFAWPIDADKAAFADAEHRQRGVGHGARAIESRRRSRSSCSPSAR